MLPVAEEVKAAHKGQPCHCHASTGICGCITRGSGELDFHGYWQKPCPHGREYEQNPSEPCGIHAPQPVEKEDCHGGCSVHGHQHPHPAGMPLWFALIPLGLAVVGILWFVCTHHV